MSYIVNEGEKMSLIACFNDKNLYLCSLDLFIWFLFVYLQHIIKVAIM